MELKIGTKIRYTSAAGTREAKILDIKIGPTADPKRLNTWITLYVPKQQGVMFEHQCQIPGDSGSISAFKVRAVA